MTKLTHIAIAGTNGRMGRELIYTCLTDNKVLLNEALVRAESPYLGQKAATLTSLSVDSIQCSSQDKPFDKNTDVLIDFTLPDNLISNLARCVSANIAIVIGTTGFTKQQQLVINQAATQIPILQASNMSLGVTLTLALLRRLTTMLGDTVGVKITETHHVNKKDAPSGTALSMAKVIANTLNKELDDCLVIDDLTDPKPGFIHVNSIREGKELGVHTVSFHMQDEQIDITHRSGNRQIYAKGAIKAANWLANKKPGLYSMDDILAL